MRIGYVGLEKIRNVDVFSVDPTFKEDCTFQRQDTQLSGNDTG
jgi:hypothetical protein